MNKKKEYSAPGIKTWFLLRQIAVLLLKYEDTEFTKIGLTVPQYFIIAAIKYLPSPVTPTDLSKWLDRNLNTITLTLDRMEKAGLVKKRRDLPDRRTLRLSLTAKSRELFDRATPRFIELPEEVTDCLSEAEKQAYIELTQKLIVNLVKKLDITELNTHRIDTINYLLRSEDKAYEPITVDLTQVQS